MCRITLGRYPDLTVEMARKEGQPARPMWKVDVSVESNGIVFFDPTVVRAYYGEALSPGENLFRRFTTSDEGDAVLAGGVFVPILAIDDLGYDVVVRLEEEASTLPPEWILSTNEHYALRVDDRLVVADRSAALTCVVKSSGLNRYPNDGGGEVNPMAILWRREFRAAPGAARFVFEPAPPSTALCQPS